MNPDHIQNQVILIKHHVLDAKKNLSQLTGDKDIIDSSLNDILEAVESISHDLPKPLEKEVSTIKEKVRNIFNQ